MPRPASFGVAMTVAAAIVSGAASHQPFFRYKKIENLVRQKKSPR